MRFLPVVLLILVVLGCGGRLAERSVESESSKPSPTIEFSTPQWTTKGSQNQFLEINFEVANTSGRALEMLKVIANFYDEDGQFLSSETTHVDRWQSLPPNQRSPVKFLLSQYDRRIKSARFDFTCKGEGVFETVDVIATEMAEAKPARKERPKSKDKRR